MTDRPMHVCSPWSAGKLWHPHAAFGRAGMDMSPRRTPGNNIFSTPFSASSMASVTEKPGNTHLSG